MPLIQPFENKVLKTPHFWGVLGHLRPFLRSIFEAKCTAVPEVVGRPSWAKNVPLFMYYMMVFVTKGIFCLTQSNVYDCFYSRARGLVSLLPNRR